MDIETLETGSAFQTADLSLPNLDLSVIVEKMKRTNSWLKGELNSIVLLNTNEKQIVITAVHKGTEITSFQENDSLSVQIFDGEVNFQTVKESVTLNKGQMLTLHEHIEYSLISKKEAVLLLTIANDNVRRLEN